MCVLLLCGVFFCLILCCILFGCVSFNFLWELYNIGLEPLSVSIWLRIFRHTAKSLAFSLSRSPSLSSTFNGKMHKIIQMNKVHEYTVWTFVTILFELNFIQTHFICCANIYVQWIRVHCARVCMCRQQIEIFLFYRKRQVCMRLPLSLSLNYSRNYSRSVTVAVSFLSHSLYIVHEYDFNAHWTGTSPYKHQHRLTVKP